MLKGEKMSKGKWETCTDQPKLLRTVSADYADYTDSNTRDRKQQSCNRCNLRISTCYLADPLPINFITLTSIGMALESPAQ